MMDDDDRQFWDSYWVDQRSTLTARTMTQILDRIKLGYLRSLLPRTGRFLEVGAGSGRLSCFLAMEGYQTACLDYSMEALRAAQANYSAAHVGGWSAVGGRANSPVRDHWL